MRGHDGDLQPVRVGGVGVHVSGAVQPLQRVHERLQRGRELVVRHIAGREGRVPARRRRGVVVQVRVPRRLGLVAEAVWRQPRRSADLPSVPLLLAARVSEVDNLAMLAEQLVRDGLHPGKARKHRSRGVVVHFAPVFP